MKINWAYLKKPSVLIGAVILFFILLFLLNKGGSSSSSGQTVVTTGPSDAQVAAQTQMAMAQLSAGLQGQALAIDYEKAHDANATQLALAQLALTGQNQSLAVQQSIAQQTIAAQTHGLDLQYQTALANNNFALDYAQQQFAYGLASQTITANLQAEMSAQQFAAFKFGTIAQLAANAGHDGIPGSGNRYISQLSQVGTIS